jgi:hypothetical protein
MVPFWMFSLHKSLTIDWFTLRIFWLAVQGDLTGYKINIILFGFCKNLLWNWDPFLKLCWWVILKINHNLIQTCFLIIYKVLWKQLPDIFKFTTSCSRGCIICNLMALSQLRLYVVLGVKTINWRTDYGCKHQNGHCFQWQWLLYQIQ